MMNLSGRLFPILTIVMLSTLTAGCVSSAPVSSLTAVQNTYAWRVKGYILEVTHKIENDPEISDDNFARLLTDSELTAGLKDQKGLYKTLEMSVCKDPKLWRRYVEEQNPSPVVVLRLVGEQSSKEQALSLDYQGQALATNRPRDLHMDGFLRISLGD